MQALGFIETRGLTAAIEGADAMLKAAEVHLIDRSFVKGGIVTITVCGDVAACKASVDAGIAAVEKMRGIVLSHHVIPRPHEGIGKTFFSDHTEADTKKGVNAVMPSDITESADAKPVEAKLPKEADSLRKQVGSLMEAGNENGAEALLNSQRAAALKKLIVEEYPEIKLENGADGLSKKEIIEIIINFCKQL